MALLHFLPTQPNSIHLHKSKGPESEQLRIKNAGRFKGILKAVWDLALMFGKRTTIHGLNHLLGETAGLFERIIWLLTVILAFGGSIYVCLLVSHRFKEGKFQTVVDSTRLPVYQIYFPVITICNLNQLNWERIEEAKKIFLPNENSTEKLRLFERIVGTYDGIEFGKFEDFGKLENESLDSMNHVNFSLVVDFMTWRCEELLTNCAWRHAKMDCCKIFFKRSTKSGPCWAFNTLESDEGRHMRRIDPMYPWRTGGAGRKSALEVRVLINPDKHFPNRTNPKGLSVMIAEPNVWHTDPFTVPANTDTVVGIDSIMYVYGNDTRSVSSDQRQCVFENERSSSDFKSLQNYVYMIENCQSECHQEYLMRFCNCSVDLLFPPGPYPSCKVKDLPCLARNTDLFFHSHQPGESKYVRIQHKGMICKCFRSCYSLNYLPEVRSSLIPARMRENRSYVDLDAHFHYETIMVYRTSLVFGWVDLMVAFGGIAGLFLGCSLISAVELAYFAFVEMPSFVFRGVRSSKKERLSDSNVTENFTYPVKHQGTFNKFGGNLHRNQFEEFVIKNNAVSTQAPPNTSLEPGKLFVWQHNGASHGAKSFKKRNQVFY